MNTVYDIEAIGFSKYGKVYIEFGVPYSRIEVFKAYGYKVVVIRSYRG